MLKKVLMVLGIAAQVSLFADPSQGETLERNAWQNITSSNWEKVDALLAPCYQSVSLFGTYNRDQIQTMMRKYKAADLTFSDFKVTESQNLIVITYTLTSDITMGDKHVISKDCRLSVWQKIGDNWQWVAYANVTPGAF
jgi:hypothetical protein